MYVSSWVYVVVAYHVLSIKLILVFLEHLLLQIAVELEVEVLANEFIFVSNYIFEKVFFRVNLKDKGLLSVTESNH